MEQAGPAAPHVWALTGHQAHLLVSFQLYFLKDTKYIPVTELPQNKTKATHPGSGQTCGAPGDSGDPGGPGPPPPQLTQPGSVPTLPHTSRGASRTPAPFPPTGISWLCSYIPVSIGHSRYSLSLPVSILTVGIPDLITHHQTHF